MIAYSEAPGQEKERHLLAGGSLGHESQLLSDITRSKPNFPPFLNTLILDYPDSRTMALDFTVGQDVVELICQNARKTRQSEAIAL